MIRYGQIAAEHWETLDGYCVAHNVPDLREMELDRFCNFVWWWATRNAQDQQEIEKLRAQLWRPPPGQVPHPESPWSPENESKAFSSFKAQVGPKK